jgi:hypothetical protein
MKNEYDCCLCFWNHTLQIVFLAIWCPKDYGLFYFLCNLWQMETDTLVYSIWNGYEVPLTKQEAHNMATVPYIFSYLSVMYHNMFTYCSAGRWCVKSISVASKRLRSKYPIACNWCFVYMHFTDRTQNAVVVPFTIIWLKKV